MAITADPRWRLEAVIPDTTAHPSQTVYLDTEENRLVYIPTNLLGQLTRELKEAVGDLTHVRDRLESALMSDALDSLVIASTLDDALTAVKNVIAAVPK